MLRFSSTGVPRRQPTTWPPSTRQALYEHAKSVANFPDAAYLADDLSHQVRLKQLIDRASEALALRRATR